MIIKHKQNKSILFLLYIFFAIVTISIGYCNINNVTLKIEGIAKTEETRILYIDSIKKDKTTSSQNAGYNSYKAKGTNLQIEGLILPKENVTEDTNITILVNLYNLSDITYKFTGVEFINATDEANANIKIDETSYQSLINSIVDANSIDGFGTLTVPISFKYTDISNITNNTFEISIKLNFEQYEKQRYTLKTGKDLYTAISSHYQDATQIEFCAKSEVPDGATFIEEAGINEGEIKAYWKDTTVYIAAANKFSIIDFNADSGYMFSNGKTEEAFSNVTSIMKTRGVAIDTSNVTNFEEMFKGCVSLTSSGLQSFINYFDTSSAVNMCAMFGSVREVTELDLSGFDTSNVTDMSWMFEQNTKLIDVNLGGKFSTVSVSGTKENEGFAGMFIQCNNLKVLDLTSFDTENVKSMWQMFKECTSLEKIYVTDKFVTTGLKASNQFYKADLFLNCTKLEGDNGTTFAKSKITDSSYAKLDGGEELPGYFSKSVNYTVTLNANGGEFTEGGTKKTYTGTNKVRMKFADTPVYEGKYFAGWAEKAEAKDPQYYNGETVVFSKDTTLYAIWHDKLTVTLKTGKNIYAVISDYQSIAEHVVFSYKKDTPEEGCKTIGNLDVENTGIVEAIYEEDTKTIYFAVTDDTYGRITFNTDSSHMFSNGKTIDTAFNKLKTIKGEEEIQIDTSKVQDFSEIFKYNISLEEESLQAFINKFDTSSVKNMCAMFEYISISSIDISHFNTDEVTDMSWMFHGSTLTNIIFGDNFNSSRVVKFDGMFQEMSKMVHLDISKIKVSSGATINYMFGKNPILQKIYVAEDSGFEKIGKGERVFEGDIALVGGSGENETKFTALQVGGDYARISTKDTPGYLTDVKEK